MRTAPGLSTTQHTRQIDVASAESELNDEEVLSAIFNFNTQPELKTLSLAKSLANWPEWDLAIKDELDSLEENKVWDVVDRPKVRKVVDSMWVFKHKLNADGSIDRYKAR